MERKKGLESRKADNAKFGTWNVRRKRKTSYSLGVFFLASKLGKQHFRRIKESNYIKQSY